MIFAKGWEEKENLQKMEVPRRVLPPNSGLLIVKEEPGRTGREAEGEEKIKGCFPICHTGR